MATNKKQWMRDYARTYRNRLRRKKLCIVWGCGKKPERSKCYCLRHLKVKRELTYRLRIRREGKTILKRLKARIARIEAVMRTL